jgi:hypothetical protein
MDRKIGTVKDQNLGIEDGVGRRCRRVAHLIGEPLSREVLMVIQQKYSWQNRMSTRAIITLVEVTNNFHYKAQ